MTPATDTPADSTSRRLEAIAFWLLTGVLVARAFLGEMPYRTSVLKGLLSEPDDAVVTRTAAREELARLTFAIAILAAAGAWSAAGALRRRLRMRHGWLAIPAGGFIVWSLVSTLCASDVRTALDAWGEQATLLIAAMLMIQLCADRRRFAWMVVALAAMGTALAAKGVYQVAVEIPERIAAFEADPGAAARQAGFEPGSTRAAMLGERIADRSPTGYAGLANVFASLLLVGLAASAALAAKKLFDARRTCRRWRENAKRGEIHLPTLAAVLTLMATATIAVVAALTRSRGAIAAACVGAIGAAGLGLWGRRLAHQRRLALGCAAGAVLLIGAGVVAWGLHRDGLPTKTLTFRWYYWTTGAEIARDHPLFGVGPANFDSAYTRYRRIEAEEAVRMPHNGLVHAAACYGLIGGALYALLLAGALIGLTGPPADDASSGDVAPPRPREVGIVAGGLAAAVLLSRGLWAQAGGSTALLVVEGLIPAAVLGGAVLLAAWTGGRRLTDIACGRAVRITLGCGLAAFVLHNMVTFSLWTPAAATAFWCGTGALLARTRCRPWRLDVLARPKALAAGAGLVAAVALLWLPVWRRVRHTEAAVQALASGRTAAAADHAVRAAKADSLDPVAAGDAARVLLASGRCNAAISWSEDTCGRDPKNAAHRQLAASITRRCAPRIEGDRAHTLLNEAANHMREAVRRNPRDARLRLEYADVLAAIGAWDACGEQLAAAERIDAVRRRMDSGFRLTPTDRTKLKALRKTLQAHRMSATE
ncbi:MAG: O-antigen ligase family protein [Phycisphaerae bacterium]|nr:O-antigen ligase family protein [Phycisphaerae bacterium]